ncbi:P63C domain-containing protein [Paraburkholderia aspalathi]|uniref:P63C domain-containing protein n=1 Tax=Paraburkholderia aspalathi TaxID=1324617 RepID=UPI0038B769F6
MGTNRKQTAAKKVVPAKTTTGRAKGGVARASSMSKEKRSLIAKKAAIARWGAKPLDAIRRGSFQEDFGLDVDCYVLNDEQRTAVISQTGMAVAIGLSSRGNAFPRFATGKAMADYLGAELQEKIANPLKFQWGSGGADVPPTTVNGYDVTLLIDVCKAILEADADGALSANQAALARQARIILNASAKAGIKGLVYALAGYDATKEEVVAAFKLYVAQEAREYEREFPPQLYEHWYRLYKIQKPERGRPWKARSLTIEHVYHPLARSSGRVLELMRALQAKSSDRNAKLHQFLSDLGVKALRTHVGQLLGIAGISKTDAEYESHVRTLFGDQPDLPGIE